MTYFLASISLVTLLFWLLYKQTAIRVCAVCAATVITWTGGIVALYTNQSWANPPITAILMGASLGALAEKYGKKLGLFWKTAVVVLGLPGIYFIIAKDLLKGLIPLGLLAILSLILPRQKHEDTAAKQTDIFNDCC